MNVLVTGAGGFLGLYIVEQLVARGAKVRALSRQRYAALDDLGVESIQADVRDDRAVMNKVRRSGPPNTSVAGRSGTAMVSIRSPAAL